MANHRTPIDELEAAFRDDQRAGRVEKRAAIIGHDPAKPLIEEAIAYARGLERYAAELNEQLHEVRVNNEPNAPDQPTEADRDRYNAHVTAQESRGSTDTSGDEADVNAAAPNLGSGGEDRA